MCSCKRSACIRRLFLLTAIQLVCHAFNCNCTASNEFTATHPNTHPAQRVATSTPRVRLNDSVVLKAQNGSDYQIKTETSTESNSLVTVKTDDSSSSRHASNVTVLDHVTSLSPYVSPTSDSLGHVTDTTNDSTAIEKTGSNFTSDVIVTSSLDVRGNGVAENTPTTSPETIVSVSGGRSAWEIPTTDVEPRETLQHTSRSGNETFLDQLMTSSVTSPSHASRHLTRDLIDRGISSLAFHRLQIVL